MSWAKLSPTSRVWTRGTPKSETIRMTASRWGFGWGSSTMLRQLGPGRDRPG